MVRSAPLKVLKSHLFGSVSSHSGASAHFSTQTGSCHRAPTCYYMDGRVRKVEDFLKTRLLDTLSEQINKVFKVVHSHAPGKKVWLGGVGPAWAAGTNNLSDTYAAGFLWLNTLGMAAVQGVDVVLRHSLFDYGYTRLVDQHFNPLPELVYAWPLLAYHQELVYAWPLLAYHQELVYAWPLLAYHQELVYAWPLLAYHQELVYAWPLLAYHQELVST
ncbi:unnamed protein product [Arctogadus glacialis]